MRSNCSTVKYRGCVNTDWKIWPVGFRQWRREGDCVYRGQERNAGRSSPVTDGPAEMSRCACVCVCLSHRFLCQLVNNTKLVSRYPYLFIYLFISNFSAFSCFYKGFLLWWTFFTQASTTTRGTRNHNTQTVTRHITVLSEDAWAEMTFSACQIALFEKKNKYPLPPSCQSCLSARQTDNFMLFRKQVPAG